MLIPISACIAAGASVMWTVFVVFANSMSDAPTAGFSGAVSLWICWGVTVVLFGVWALQHFEVL